MFKISLDTDYLVNDKIIKKIWPTEDPFPSLSNNIIKYLKSNLDKKLPQKNYANQPVIVKEILSDKTRQGQDLIKALNDNELPIPEFYKTM